MSLSLNITATFLDHSGYGQFARTWFDALSETSARVFATPFTFERQSPEAISGSKYGSRFRHTNEALDANIIISIPPAFNQFKEKPGRKIGFSMFETSRIPSSWVADCNRMDAIFVPCQWNKEVFSRSGVTVPIHAIPMGVNHERYKRKKQQATERQKYKFYSAFQWSERKNPTGLIRGFIAAFDGNKDVSLTIKTYVKDHSQAEAKLISEKVKEIKASVRAKDPPAIFLKVERLSDAQMESIHMTHDCFVLPSRGEGLGLPYLDALMVGNPTIGTGYSGNMEYMNERNSFLLDYTLEPAFNMQHLGPWYTCDQMWAHASISDMIDKMRWIYGNQVEASRMASAARQDIADRLPEGKQATALLDAVRSTL